MAQILYFAGLRCTRCNATFPREADVLLCPHCSHLVDAEYDLDRLGRDLPRLELDKRPPTIWKWKELLPILDSDKIVTLGEGGSPLIACHALAEKMGVRAMYILDDSSMPSGSLKDRSIAVAATKAVEFGYQVLSCDSTGNKAASTAAYAARAGLRSVVFCPSDTPVPKMAQALFYGAKVIRVRGHYSEINAMYRRLIQSGDVPWYDCGTDNPYRYEGKKTYAYEIASHFGRRGPSMILHPAAGCMSLVKMWKGFRELLTLGLVDEIPALVACQAESCAPIVKAWRSGASTVSGVESLATVASAIAVADPKLLGDATLEAIRSSNGDAVAIADDRLLETWRELGRLGIFCEPSAAISVAAAQQLADAGRLSREDVLVSVVTGSGFKDFDTVLKNVEVPDDVVDGYDALAEKANEV